MRVTLNGIPLKNDLPTLINKTVKEAEQELNKLNREQRRHKDIMKLSGLLAVFGSLATTTIAYAQDPTSVPEKENTIIYKIFGPLKEKIFGDFDFGLSDNFADGISRNDTLVWKLNQFASDTIIKTHDFFTSGQILTLFDAIWYICLSFTTLIVAKKGWDMIKARMLGTSSLGGKDLIVRLLASGILTFFSLDVMRYGIKISNAVMEVFFNHLAHGIIPTSALNGASTVGGVFWLIGFIIMFIILAIRYWIRQITLVLLGVITPIASTSWVTDGGTMMSTVTKEVINILSTPIVHGILLTIGSVITFEIGKISDNAFTNALNSMLISFSTMVLMIMTPEFLRKFTHGTVNPLKVATDLFMKTKTMPARMMRMVK